MRRAPVYCDVNTPILEALQSMRAEKTRSIAVVDESQCPVGIFTLTDLMERVVLAGVDIATPVSGVMSHSPASMDEMATAQEALALMAGQGYHQLMVTREGRLAGVVSERDLFALQRVTMRNILQSIRLARDVPSLHGVSRDIDVLADNLVAQGAAAEPISISRVSAPSVGILVRAAWAEPAIKGSKPAPAASRMMA